ncbi:hypothetical protein RhiJN_26020 [Ceratobasidium sp. AG-Ba]|nr:hypothetical protein RhiJN_26020 [Ceratobasidium sp. AG-Ba]
MSWFAKKKPNPEDGDFPHVSKHYREEKTPTQTVNLVPPVQWDGATTVVWGIDIGAGTTTVSFAYLERGRDIAVHNIVYWPKEFPLRESSASGVPLPEVKSTKTFKTRGTYTSDGFVSHPAWNAEKVTAYLYTTNSTTSSPAFQIRTEVPLLESSERHKYNDLVEHLLKHALSIYGAVIKPTQPHWPQASYVIITLPNGLPKSAEMTITSTLNRSISEVMPKVIGQTQAYYVRRPDIRLFEDDLWRNVDNNFHDGDVFMLVEWDMTSGAMLCTSYKAIQLESGQMMFGTRLRSYISALPQAEKRNVGVDEREGVRFANALNWCAINKHRVQKLIIRTSNSIKKPEKLLEIFHKTLVDNDLQVGLRPIDAPVETGAFGAVVWHIAHGLAQTQNPGGDTPALVQDMTQALAKDVEANLLQPTFSQEPEPASRMSRAFNSLSLNMLGRGDKQESSRMSMVDPNPQLASTPFVSPPLAWNAPEATASPASTRSPLSLAPVPSSPGTVVENPYTFDGSAGPSSPDEANRDLSEGPMPPPAYSAPPGKSRNLDEKRRPEVSAHQASADQNPETGESSKTLPITTEQSTDRESRLVAMNP